jgi:myo-inositol 2-dehydrogenase / D-chiro-inositol 1-dehydrogenase
MISHRKIHRRRFLQEGLAVAASISIVPRYVLGGKGYTPPSEIITRAVIGTGNMGMRHVTEYPQTLAVCDVDRNNLARALKKAGGKCDGYSDWRQVMDRKDIDTIHIATPPHWHALIAIAALQSGKDVYSEKPATHFIREGRVIVDTVKRYGRVYEVNTHSRPYYHGTLMRHMVMSGLLGKPLIARRHGGFKTKLWRGRTNLTPQAVPSELDYNMWLGPAPFKPYHPHRVHQSFRGYWDYDEGGLGDMGQHLIDPIQYGLGKDDTSPVEVESYAPWPQHNDACGLWGRVEFKYADGDKLIIESGEWGESTTKDLPILEGPNGKYLNGQTDPPDLFERAMKSTTHRPNLHSWEHTVRTRENVHGIHPNAEQAHRSATLLHLASISIRLGRKLQYDPVAERFVGDEEANRFVDVPMRAPWHL